jgi:thiol-disulfide isomerase/thioredoxin
MEKIGPRQLVLRILAFLILLPATYFLWERGAADQLAHFFQPKKSLEPIRLGTAAPHVSVPADRVWSKQPIQLIDYRGKPIVLHFWATWCAPCITELPELMDLAKEERKYGTVFIAVAIDENWAKIETFFQQLPHLRAMTDSMILLLDPRAEIANAFRSSRFPETFLINHQGVMDNKFIGAQPWKDPAMKRYLDSLRAKEK